MDFALVELLYFHLFSDKSFLYLIFSATNPKTKTLSKIYTNQILETSIPTQTNQWSKKSVKREVIRA